MEPLRHILRQHAGSLVDTLTAELAGRSHSRYGELDRSILSLRCRKLVEALVECAWVRASGRIREHGRRWTARGGVRAGGAPASSPNSRGARLANRGERVDSRLADSQPHRTQHCDGLRKGRAGPRLSGTRLHHCGSHPPHAAGGGRARPTNAVDHTDSVSLKERRRPGRPHRCSPGLRGEIQ
jgi:hypothetical protein